MIQIRDARATDLPQIGRLFRTISERDPLPELPTQGQRLRVATRIGSGGDTVVGYAKSEAGKSGVKLVHLASDPSLRHQGIGRALLEDASRGEAIELYAAASVGTATGGPTNCDADAVAFYKHLGFEVVGESVSMEMCFRDVDAMPVYDARTGVLDLQHFAVFQEAFALPDSAFFPANGVTLLGAWDEGDDGAPLPLGFARFDVKFPGAFPFRVVRPAVATVLLREIERHATHAPNKGNVPDITQEFTLPTTRLVVDDDAATAGLLRVFGAIVHTDLVRLRREAHAPLSSTEFAAP